MGTRAIILALGTVLLAACGSDAVTAPTAGTSTAAPSATATTPSVSPTASATTAPAPTATAPDADPTPSPQPPPPPAAPASASVTIADFRFVPDPVEVAIGATVTWTNQDGTAHTATVSGGPDTGAIAGGASASLTFDTPGTYDYVCQFHPGTMTGTVVVS